MVDARSGVVAGPQPSLGPLVEVLSFDSGGSHCGQRVRRSGPRGGSMAEPPGEQTAFGLSGPRSGHRAGWGCLEVDPALVLSPRSCPSGPLIGPGSRPQTFVEVDPAWVRPPRNRLARDPGRIRGPLLWCAWRLNPGQTVAGWPGWRTGVPSLADWNGLGQLLQALAGARQGVGALLVAVSSATFSYDHY